MDIGVPRETKPLERRIGLTPREVAQLIQDGHAVVVECGAGTGAGYADKAYAAAGAAIASRDAVWQSELIVKVKELQDTEWPIVKSGQIVMGFMHIAENEPRCAALLATGVIAVGYEYITDVNQRAPIVAPMSTIAGKLAVVQAGNYLACADGRGTLLTATPGAVPAQAVLLGLGDACVAAAEVLVALGAEVSACVRDVPRAQDRINAANLKSVAIRPLAQIQELLVSADILIAAIWQPGQRNAVLVTREQVAAMPRGSVIIDITVDGGSPIETIRATTLAMPTYVAHGVIHAAVPNLPAGVPRTASDALAAAALPYVRAVAGDGLKAATRKNPALARGVLLATGKVTHPYVASQRGRPLVDLSSL